MRARWIITSTALVAFVAVAYSLGAAQSASRGPSKIAFISPNRLIAESPQVRTAMARLRTAQKETLTELRSKQRTLEETRRKLAQADKATRPKLEQLEREQSDELQRATAQAQTDLQASQRETMVVLQSHIKPVLDELAGSENIDAVLNSDSAIFWGSAKLDLTQAVLERLNAKSKEPAPKPKP